MSLTNLVSLPPHCLTLDNFRLQYTTLSTNFRPLSLSVCLSGESENLQLHKSGDGRGKPMYSAASSSSSEPHFRSHARTYRIKIGDSVTLSCKVENLGEILDSWQSRSV